MASLSTHRTLAPIMRHGIGRDIDKQLKRLKATLEAPPRFVGSAYAVTACQSAAQTDELAPSPRIGRTGLAPDSRLSLAKPTSHEPARTMATTETRDGWRDPHHALAGADERVLEVVGESQRSSIAQTISVSSQ